MYIKKSSGRVTVLQSQKTAPLLPAAYFGVNSIMRKFILTLLFLLLSSPIHAQFIEFEFKASLRIPYHKVNIKIEEKAGDYIMSVRSSTGLKDERWKESNKNYSHEISKELFQQLYDSIERFHMTYTPTKTDYLILDGTTWILKFGSMMDKIQIISRSPEHDTDKRNLKDFIRLCEEFVKMSGLPVKNVLYD